MGSSKKNSGSSKKNPDSSKTNSESNENSAALTEEFLQSLAQRMAHSERQTRDRAVRNLRRWLSRHGSGDEAVFSPSDVAQLWRALFVCVWMSDKPLVQENLINSVSSLMGTFKRVDSALLFLKEFFLLMAVKWGGIDKWRFDKFQALVRKVLRQTFIRGASENWSPEFVDGLVTVLNETVCNLEPAHLAKVPLGLKVHVADMFCEELAKVGVNEHLTTDVILKLVTPYMEIVQRGRDTRLVVCVVKRVFDYFLKQSDPVLKHEVEETFGVSLDEDGEEMEEDEGEEEAPSTALDPRAGGVHVDVPQIPVDYMKFYEAFFKLAGAPDIRQASRKMLYSLVKKFKDVANNVYPFPVYKKDNVDIDELNENDYNEAIERMKEFEKEIYEDSSKKMRFMELKKEKKLKRLQTGGVYAVNSPTFKIEEVKGAKNGKIRSGKKHRKILKNIFKKKVK